jgi:hypothetical protein
MRERTPSTLPPEIRQAITQMTRERSTPAPEQPAVAAAPMPVERRAPRTQEHHSPVSMTPPTAVPGPAPLPSTPAIEQAAKPKTKRVFATGRSIDPRREPVAVEPTRSEPVAAEPKPAPSVPEPRGGFEPANQAAAELGHLPAVLSKPVVEAGPPAAPTTPADAPDFPPRSSREVSRAPARERVDPSVIRRRVSERRSQLQDLVAELATLGSRDDA